MASFLDMAWSSDPQFYVTHRTVVPLNTCHSFDGVYQIVVPKSGGFYELLIKEFHVTPLASHLGVWKLTHALFQRVWWPKLHETVTSFVCSCITCTQTKDNTAVPSGLLQSLSVPESSFFLWSIDFTTDFPLSHGCNIILTSVDCLTKYTILIPCKIGD